MRFSPHYVLSDGISLLDIGAGVGVASALAARTPSVRITAIELDALLRCVLRTNLALLLPHASYVPTPPPLSRDSLPLCDGSVSSDYEKFVVDIIAGAAPDVIRLSDSHAGSFLPIVGRPSTARYVVVERHSCDISCLPSQASAIFPVGRLERQAAVLFARWFFRTFAALQVHVCRQTIIAWVDCSVHLVTKMFLHSADSLLFFLRSLPLASLSPLACCSVSVPSYCIVFLSSVLPCAVDVSSPVLSLPLL